MYYHNDRWQVLCEYDGGGGFERWYAYGNYIDEVLFLSTGTSAVSYKYYVHDHLYSPVALLFWTGSDAVERYEYDAYGNCHVLEPNYAEDADGESDYGNPYLFTGRQVDYLDSGSLRIQYNRNRYYDQYTGRWTTHDPLGITPNAHRPNTFSVPEQYRDGANIYEYGKTNPLNQADPWGLMMYPGYRLSKPWRAKCGTCGPSVTVALGFFAMDLQADFHRWSSEEQKDHCRGMWNTGGWDITPLTSTMDYTASGCGTCDCAPYVGWTGWSFRHGARCLSRACVG